MKKSMFMAVFVSVVMLAATVMAETISHNINYQGDVNFDTGCNLKIKGTKVTLTAAEMNALHDKGITNYFSIISGDLVVSNGIQVGTTAGIMGATIFGGAVTATGTVAAVKNATVGGNLTVTSNALVRTFQANGAANFASTVDITNTATIATGKLVFDGANATNVARSAQGYSLKASWFRLAANAQATITGMTAILGSSATYQGTACTNGPLSTYATGATNVTIVSGGTSNTNAVDLMVFGW